MPGWTLKTPLVDVHLSSEELERPGKTKPQTWRLNPSGDGVAFEVQTPSSRFSLDTGKDAISQWDSHPILYSTHGESWQQWMVVRLPLA